MLVIGLIVITDIPFHGESLEEFTKLPKTMKPQISSFRLMSEQLLVLVHFSHCGIR